MVFRCSVMLAAGAMDDMEFWAKKLGDRSLDFDFRLVYAALQERRALENVWLHVRGETESGQITSIEFQETPFDDEKERALEQHIYETLVPKEVRDGVRSLRPCTDLGRLIENTESGLCTREEYLGFSDAKPDAFDRDPHVEADTLAHARFFAYPVGVLVRVLENDTTYVSAVKPNWGRTGGTFSGVVFSESFEKENLDPVGWAYTKQGS